MAGNFLLLLIFLITLTSDTVNAEPCYGYTVNENTNECVSGLLYADAGKPPEYLNCYIIDICTGGKIEQNPANMNCTYIGCVNNCKENETKASVASIGCISKGAPVQKNIYSPLIIGLIILSIIAAYLMSKNTPNKN